MIRTSQILVFRTSRKSSTAMASLLVSLYQRIHLFFGTTAREDGKISMGINLILRVFWLNPKKKKNKKRKRMRMKKYLINFNKC